MRKHILGVGTACALATAGWAQQEQQPGVSAGASIGGLQAGVQANVSQQASGPVVLNFQGSTVTDQAGKQLGQIQHLLIDPSGCVDMAVLSLSGGKLVPLPWQLVQVSGGAAAQGRTTLTAKVDAQKLQQAPSFTMNQISQISQQQTIQQVNQYYGVQSKTEAVGGTGSQTGGTSSSTSSTIGSQSGTTNNAALGTQTQQTNQFGTSLTNRPGFGTNATDRTRPGRGLGRPENRPPDNRPPGNRPPENRPPSNPGQGPE